MKEEMSTCQGLLYMQTIKNIYIRQENSGINLAVAASGNKWIIQVILTALLTKKVIIW